MADPPFSGTRRHLFLSPHPDDAVLSCGGTIARLCRAGHDVLIVTVCAGSPPDPPLSELAGTFQRAMGPAEDLVGSRRSEDLLAAGVLGCRCIHLDVPDAVYRRSEAGWIYPSMTSLFGIPHGSDRSLALAVKSVLADVLEPDSSLVAPLGLGGHVDHRLTRRAAEEMGRSVLYYEEFPYGDPAYPGLPGVSSADLHPPDTGFLEGLSPSLHAIGWEDFERKIEACLKYRTQLPLVFRTAGEIVERLSQFSQRHGLPDPAERFWVPGPVAVSP